MLKSLDELAANSRILEPFISVPQLTVMLNQCKGEEGGFFIEKIAEMTAIINVMHKTYEQDGKGDQAIAHLHYFAGGCDFYITEKDIGDESDDAKQIQAFGLSNLGSHSDVEFGYISIDEITKAGAELDLHFQPKTIHEVKIENGYLIHSDERKPG